MKRISVTFFVVIAIALVSFRSKPVSKLLEVYREWYGINSSRLTVDRTKGEINYQLNYIPSEVSIFAELMDQEKVSKKELQKLSESYNAYEEYNLKISTLNTRNFLLSQSVDKEDLGEKQYYLMSEVVKDFILINGTDSLKPLRCDFENNYGSAPYINLRLVFERKKEKITKKKLVYYDVLFAQDTIEYNLDQLTQLTIPKIY